MATKIQIKMTLKHAADLYEELGKTSCTTEMFRVLRQKLKPLHIRHEEEKELYDDVIISEIKP